MTNASSEKLLRLGHWANEGPNEYLENYFANCPDFEKYLRGISGPKALASVHDLSDVHNKVFVGSLFNDLVQVRLESSGKAQLRMFSQDDFERVFGTSVLRWTVPADAIERCKIDTQALQQLMPSFMLPADDAAASALSAMSPLISSGHVLVQPRRILIFRSREPHPRDADGNCWVSLFVSDENFVANWEVDTDAAAGNTLPIVWESGLVEGEIAEITLPYIKGIDAKTLAEILIDEHNRIAAFRSAIKTLVAEGTKSSRRVHELQGDVVRPELEKIERKLRQIASSRRIRLAGWSLGFVSLSLGPAASPDVTSFAIKVGATGTLGMLFNEIANSREKQGDIAENPYYLLWRLRRAKRN